MEVGASARDIAGGHASAVFGNDEVADGEAEAAAVGFAEGDEGLEDMGQDLWRDARAGIDDLGHDLFVIEGEADLEAWIGALGEGVEGILEEVVEDPLYPEGIEADEDFEGIESGRLDDGDSAEMCGRSEFDEGFVEEAGVVDPGQDGGGSHAAGEVEQLLHHAVEHFDLAAHPVTGRATHFEGDGRFGSDVSGDADDIEGVSEVVDDGAGETFDEGEPFGLEEFLEETAVEVAHPQAAVADEIGGKKGGTFEEGLNELGGDEMSGYRFECNGGSGAGAAVEYRHFPEVIPGFHDGQPMHATGDGTGGDFDGAFAEDVEAIALGTFLEEAGCRRVETFLGAEGELTHGIPGQMPGETRFCEVHHG